MCIEVVHEYRSQSSSRCTIRVMFRPEIKIKIEEELARGEAARGEGFEGRARVCARRAAGAAVREYLEVNGFNIPGPSAVELLSVMLELPGIPGQARQSADYLLMRVDEAFSLPPEVDLLSEARRLVDLLEKLV